MRKALLFTLLLSLLFALSACTAPTNSPVGSENNSQINIQQSSGTPEQVSTLNENSVSPEADKNEAEQGNDEKGFWGKLFSSLFGSKNISNSGADLSKQVGSGSNLISQEAQVLREKPAIIGLSIGADLKICGLGSSCSGDMGSVNWLKAVSMSVGNTKRALDWKVEAGKADGGLLEISRTPMKDAWPAEVIYSQNVAYGQFIFDFSSLFVAKEKENIVTEKTPNIAEELQATAKPSSLIGKIKLPAVKKPINVITPKNSIINKELNIDFKKLAAIQPVYYVRVVPLLKGKIAGRPTNEIKVTVVAPSENQEFKLYSPAKIYDVKIKSFEPLKAPDKGVCSNAMILDTAGLIPKAGGMGFENHQVGDRICPLPYRGVGEQAWYESLWNAVTSGLSWVSQAYNDIKSAVVDAVGSVACGGNEDCKKALSAGLDMGLVALGIPPTIPNFDQLVDGGFDYLAGELSSAAGCPDAVCREAIKAGLKNALEQKKNTNPACMDAAVAHNMGMEPLCLPTNMKAHFDPAATHRGAQVVLTVTRNNTPVTSEKTVASSSYRILLSTGAKNDGPVGSSIINIEPYGKSLKIEKPLEGELFRYSVLSLPYIAPGESIDIPIQLTPTDYWVPGHKELMGGWTTVTYKDGWPQYQYNDWWRFYYGAELNLVAQIDGCQYQGGNECIISIDSLKTKLPMTLNP